MAFKSLMSTVFILFALGCSNLLGDFTVTMTGTIATGTLNGASIDGESFVIDAEIATGEDLMTTLNSLGFFALSQAAMQIGSSDQFIFDASTTYYAQRYDSLTFDFAVGFISPLSADNQLAYIDRQQSNLGFSFDPSVIQPFTYSAFNDQDARGLASGTNGGAALFVHGASSLVIDDLSLNGASITVIPEPGLFGVVFLSVFGFVSRSRRDNRTIRSLHE